MPRAEVDKLAAEARDELQRRLLAAFESCDSPDEMKEAAMTALSKAFEDGLMDWVHMPDTEDLTNAET